MPRPASKNQTAAELPISTLRACPRNHGNRSLERQSIPLELDVALNAEHDLGNQ